ncbi:MAG: PP2C family protein-serine/threonine phosphatase [Chloroflexota bacterium]
MPGATAFPLDGELIAEVLAPFGRMAPALTVTLEVAGSSPRGAEIRADDRLVGWLVPHGDDAGTPVVTAAVAALASVLGRLVAEQHARRQVETELHSLTTEAAAEQHRRIDDELALGRRLQRSFLTMVAPDVPGYEIASHYEQANEVGGDFFDLFRLLRRGRPLSVVVADVTGKGVAAALLMAFARPLIHAAIDNAARAADALERANRVLRERRASLFITALCGTLSLNSGRLRLANAGHESPLLIPHDGSPTRAIESSGSLLGVFPSLGLAETVTDLAPGDVVVFYTDGVTDARSTAGERFNEGRLLAAIEMSRAGTAGDIVDEISAAVDRFQAGTPAADDVTVVAIGRRARRRRAVGLRTSQRGGA